MSPTRQEIRRMSNSELIQKANKLDLMLWESPPADEPAQPPTYEKKKLNKKEIRERHRRLRRLSKIATILVSLYDEMERRINIAKKKEAKERGIANPDKYVPLEPPKMKDVKWDTSQLLSPLVRGISPFHMIELWQLFIIKERPKVKVQYFDGEVITAEKIIKKPPPCPVPKNVTGKMAADQARDAMSKSSPPNLKKLFSYCILHKIQDSSADMWFMTSLQMGAVINKEMDLQTTYQEAIVNDAGWLVAPPEKGGRIREEKIPPDILPNLRLKKFERKKLDSHKPNWVRKALYATEHGFFHGTQHDVNIFVGDCAKILVKPEITKYFWTKHENARKILVRDIRSNWCNDKMIVQKLIDFRGVLMSAEREWRRRNPEGGVGAQPSWADRFLIGKTWNKKKESRNSILWCIKEYRDQ